MKRILKITFIILLLSSCSQIRRAHRGLASSELNISCNIAAMSIQGRKGYWLGDISEVSYNIFDEQIHVTQFLYGRPGVLNRKIELDSLSFSELQEYIAEKPIPYVLGPDGMKYIIDRHHFSRSLFEMRARLVEKFGEQANELQISFQKVNIYGKDSSTLSDSEFGETMIENKLTYLRKGSSFRSFNELPTHISDIEEDYYRGLAWIVRKSGAFVKTDVPFAEFYWGEYFEKALGFQKEKLTKKKIRKAIRATLVINDETSQLPGFIGDRYQDEASLDEAVEKFMKKLKRKKLLDLYELE